MTRFTTALALIATSALAAPAFAEGAGYFDTIVAERGATETMSTRSAPTEFVKNDELSVSRYLPVDQADFSASAQGAERFVPGTNK